MPVRRHSSRRERLDSSLLQARLAGALGYDRIAGYFRSSLLEVAVEAIERVTGKVRVVCNSDLEPEDVATAKAAQQALRQSWCAGEPERLAGTDAGRARFGRLYDLLSSGKLEVRVLPDQAFGLVHGKAGVIRYRDGRATCFLGSVNESLTAWRLNYELLWEDDDPEAVAWVQAEFDALWGHPLAVPLADFVMQDVARLARREETPLADWRRDPGGGPRGRSGGDPRLPPGAWPLGPPEIFREAGLRRPPARDCPLHAGRSGRAREDGAARPGRGAHGPDGREGRAGLGAQATDGPVAG